MKIAACVFALMLCAPSVAEPERPTHPFDQDWLVAHARQLAKRPHRERVIDESGPLAELGYDEYRAIRPERGASIWHGEGRGFTLDLLHLGFIYRTPVNVNLVVDDVSRRVLYTPKIFDYEGDNENAMDEPDVSGYAGFRVATAINTLGRLDEFLVFQGASYFRAVAAGLQYGLSARGLAIDTAATQGEEFPLFTDFWIERPEADAGAIVIHALLQSESLTGAYKFRTTPGEQTALDVEAVLFPRVELGNIGLAPLTSMFLFDDTNRARFDDFRPAVHDSDGLQIEMADGERVWRPLANPQRLQVSAFVTGDVAGFGLMQRHRKFEDFSDSEARYELRPSVWIEPGKGWPEGSVELVEIPTREEINDNIVAFWQPADALRPGQQYEFAYQMTWGAQLPRNSRSGQILNTRSGAVEGDASRRKFVIDYSGVPPADEIDIAVTSTAGTIENPVGHVVSATGNYRVFFDFVPDRVDLAELRVAVHADSRRWGETWLYRWTP